MFNSDSVVPKTSLQEHKAEFVPVEKKKRKKTRYQEDLLA